MPYCAAFNCTNSSSKDSGRSFFGFPKDEAIRTIWVHRVRRKNFVPSKYSKLCSDHFAKSAYERDPEELERLGYSGGRAKLKSDAVPTLFMGVDSQKWSSEPVTIRPAYAKRQRKEVISQATAQNVDQQIASTSADFQEHLEMEPIAVQSEAVEQEVAPKSQRHVKCQALLVPNQCTRRIQVTPTTRNYAVQVNTVLEKQCVLTGSTGSQCNLIGGELASVLGNVSNSESDLNSSDSETQEYHDPSDPDFLPPSDSDHDSDDEYCGFNDIMPLQADVDPKNERQFLVTESCLVKLLVKCQQCGCDTNTCLKRISGTMIVTESICLNNHVILWHSQNIHKKIPYGNILFCGAVLFSGSSPSNVLCLFNHLKIPIVSLSTYIRIQNAYLCPAVSSVWTEFQHNYLQTTSTKLLALGGDGRCDSPGHSAKYCTYSIMDLQTKCILDVQLVQVNEVKGSVHMELEGLRRALEYLQEQGCLIGDLVTDRHVMVKKFMRENHSDVNHYFDVWHMTKGQGPFLKIYHCNNGLDKQDSRSSGVGKKLEAASKKKDCGNIRPWIKSITNHMYWVAATDDPSQKKAMWESIVNHIVDVHEGHSEQFTKCTHGEVTEKRKWLVQGSRPHKLVKEVVTSPYLTKDVEKLSPLYQTYGLEVYHSVVNNFASKNIHYFYSAMLARSLLAALHNNENCNKDVLRTRDGDLQWQICYPKAQKGEEAVVKPVKAKPTYSYVDDLVAAVIQRRRKFPSYRRALCDAKKIVPESKTKSYPIVNKADLIKRHTSRFQKP